MNYFLIPLEGNKNPGKSTGLKIHLQDTTDIEKESDKLYISVSNAKDIIDHFINLANKFVWGRLLFMVDIGVGVKNIFKVVEKIRISYMHVQKFGYFVLKGIGNVDQVLPNPFTISALTHLVGGNAIETQKLYHRVR